MQLRQRKSQGVCALIALCLMGLSACSSKNDNADAGEQPQQDGSTPYDQDAMTAEHDAGPASTLCAKARCADGQKCEESGGEAVCVPSCAAVSCSDGEHCQIQGRYGVCVKSCEPACGSGQRCEDGACVDNTCEQLECGATEACIAVPSGSGNQCADNTCEDDVGCSESQSCRDGICVGDMCAPGARHCDERRVLECAPNGASLLVRMTCTNAAFTESTCEEAVDSAHCTCRDDWDCPEFSHCLSGRCEGTGRTPHCFLPATGFAALLPEDEPGFPWGGDDTDGYTSGGALQHGTPERSRDAKGHPFPRHAQVTSTPLVANLDDDNGDGLVNELDLPELIFTSFCDTNYYNHGVLRALHGGGAKAGKELFARCGEKLWHEGDAIVDGSGAPLPAADCGCTAGDIEPTGAPAVGDLDNDGFPEIVVTAHPVGAGSSDVKNTRVLILNRRGELISDNAVGDLAGADPAVTLANLDGEGFVEIVVGARVFVLEDQVGTLKIGRILVGDKAQGLNNSQGAIACVADLDDDRRMEVVVGGTAYKFPHKPAGACPLDTSGLNEDELAYCSGQLRVMWSAPNVDGFCAIADVLAKRDSADDPEPYAGVDKPLDGKPEVVVIASGHLRIFDGRTGLSRVDQQLTGGAGGPPNIDDFDGDGFPEIGTAGSTAYVLYDPQPATAKCPTWPNELDGLPAADAAPNSNPARMPPAQSCNQASDCGDTSQFGCSRQDRCVCLHNGWKSKTQDASSNVTGSSVFDFNGDGAAEVVYNDECYFRIYDGATGSVYQRLDSQSPTRIEYPVVADVDNDGNAEIVFSAGNARSEDCPSQGQTPLRNGLRVIGDPGDRWVSARRIWNEHAYHVTNVLESGAVPLAESPNWLSYADRSYNTYRSNPPPLGHVAPDLTVLAIGVTSPGLTCGQALSRDIRIVARIANQGDLRVGQNVLVRFFDQADNKLGESPLGVGLEPQAEVRITLDYQAQDLASIPSRVKVVVDATEDERECVEDNNSMTKTISTRDKSPELSVSIEQLDNKCPVRHVRVRVENSGTARVEDVPVELYAGQPSAGGTLLSGHNVGAIEAKGSAEFETDIDTVARDIRVFAVVNPASTVVECDESNNTAQTQIMCNFGLN